MMFHSLSLNQAEALAIRTEVLGPYHPATKAAREALAALSRVGR